VPNSTQSATDAESPAQLAPSFFHVGVVVDDIETAIARYSEVFGISFSEPETALIPYMADPDPIDGPVQQIVAFARTAPPFYQLIQAGENGVFSAANTGKVLYYGYWETDMAARIKRLDELGIGIDVRMAASADALPYAVITAPDLLGVRVQYVNPSLHPSLYQEGDEASDEQAPASEIETTA
jgi:catechol 2,3-dioxygenase-like lactoylglutathione lyase family enzyme